MKIFNWVQKRFHHGSLRDGLAQNVKKAESITNEADKQLALKQAALAEVLDGWKDGILTIGTLGFDPLKPFNQKTNEYVVLENQGEQEEEEEGEGKEKGIEEEGEEYHSPLDEDMDDTDVDSNYYDYNAEDEEVNPLMYTTFDHSFHGVGIEDFEAKSEIIMSIDGVELSSGNNQDQIMKRKGERKTLAELFLADSDVKKKADAVEIITNSAKKPVAQRKNGLSFAKKFIPHVGEDSRPVKKLQQIMKRMMKRKIHPELEGKAYKMENQNKPAGMVEAGISDASESVSLLQTLPGLAI